MPRDGGGVYSKPTGTTAVSSTTIESAKYNQTVDDLVADANTARPVVAGGTGATSPSAGLTALAAGNASVSGSLRFDDDVSALFGTGSDAAVSFISASSALRVTLESGIDFEITDSNGDLIYSAFDGGGSSGYYQGTQRYLAGNSGLEVFGDIKVNGSDFLLNENDFATESTTQAPSQQSARAFIGGEASVEVDLTGQTTASITALSTGINKIRVAFSDANLSGTDDMLVQVSTGASFVTTGYESSSVALSASTPATSRGTAGFILRRSNASTSAAGFFELTRVPGTHKWFVEAKAHIDGVAAVLVSSGYIDLGSELDGVQLLTTGSNTFDSGAVQFILR